MKRISILLMMLMGVFAPLVMNGQNTYSFSSIPTTGWSRNGGTQTINNVPWTYSSSTYIGVNNGRIQIGSQNSPQTSNWTIQTPISSFGSNIIVTGVSITAYTTRTTATYDISVGGNSVKSGNLTTSSATYSATNLSYTSGNIVVTMRGSNNSRAMYLSNISVTYTIACSPFPITYTYGFEDASDFDCWTTVDCESCSNNSSLYGLYTSSSYAHNGTHLFVFSSYCGETDPQYLISPELTGVANGVHVEFYYAIVDFAQGAPETFKVGYSTTDDNVSSFTWPTNAQRTCTSSTYEHFSANFMGQVKYVAVQYTSADSYYLFLDDFIFEEAPNCLEPTDVVASNETTTSATISWTAGGSETEWDLYYTSNPSDVPTASTTPSISGITTNSRNLTSLTAATTYHVYVRAACSSTETSAWSNPCIFNTDCYEMALPYSYGFEDGALSVCWTPINENPIYMSIEVSATNPHTGTYHLNLDRRTPSGTQIIVLPEVDATYTLSNYEISFYAMLSNGGNSNYTTTGRTLTIGVMTDPMDESTFVAVGSTITPGTSYAQYTFDLSSYTGNGQYIAIKHDESASGNNGYTYIDDLQITALPCPVPSGLSATNITAASATLGWTGDQSAYNVRYRSFTAGAATTTTEDFEGQTAAAYTATGELPNGWNSYTTNDYKPHVSNNSSYSYISNHSGNYLLMTTNSSATGSVYAIMPKYENLTAVSFYYVFESTSSCGTLEVGYVTDNTGYSTFQRLGDAIQPATAWSSNPYTLSSSDINTINSVGGYVAFKYNSNSTTYYSAAIDDVVVTASSITYGAWNTSNTNVSSPLNISNLTPNTDYQWQVQGVNCDGNGTPTDWSATASFTTLNGITVTATADPAGSGTFAFTGSGVISSDATSALVNPTGDVTITATGAAGYTFMNWTEGGSTVSTSNPYTLTGVNASHSLTAHFVNMTAGDTWPTAVTSLAATSSGYSESGDNITISNANGLAWLISTINGLNGQSTALSGKTITLTADVDMSAHDWVPIGTTERPFTCTFDGNGHIIKGITRNAEFPHNGLFGYVSGTANIQNVVVQTALSGNCITMGAIAGTFASTGIICNVEGAGTLNSDTRGTLTTSMGGLVGDNLSGTIHSSFAVNTITSSNASTHVGGLVGNNAGDLLNSYANTTISGSGQIGCLVGTNTGTVENCYAVVGSQSFPAFAHENNGTIQYCYADNDNGYVGSGTAPTGHGTYSTTQNTHTYGYMYWDNSVTLASGQSSDYVVDTIKYANNQIDKWPGLLSTLEHWVESTNGNTSLYPAITFTKWLRPTTKYINDDLPVLCFPRDNCMLTIDSEGKALRYGPFDGNSHSTYISRGTYPVNGSLGNQGFGQEPQGSGDDNNNGIDDLLEENPSGHLFVYDNAINVERVPNANLFVYINEDVVFKQAASAGAFINTQVGVSFDNSWGNAKDFFGNKLAYDWHMLSTPLANAPIGISYNGNAENWWETGDHTQVTSVSNSYMPDGTGNDHHWDFYSFYEPEYHWINLKRNSSSHYHYDEPHDFINYTNESIMVPGKGYMTAIDKDSYLCNTGTLNGPTNPVSITLTKRSHEPGIDELGFNLLGNPYQAYLDVNGFLGRNSLSSYWVYIAESNNYIAGNADASSNPVLPSATLHPHQGFFVLATSDDQTVNFDYSTMALSNPEEHSYFRGGKVNYPLVNLFVADNNGMKDLAVIEFHRPKTDGSKKMRAINNADFELAAFNDGERYSILFTEKGVSRVPVTFITSKDDEFTMTWSTLYGQFTQLFLVDNITGSRTDMLNNDHYTFNGSTDETAWRFYIEFNCIDDDDDDTESSDFFAWFDGSNWIVNGKGQLQLFDVLGHMLQSQVVNGEQTRLNLNNYAAGIYMLQLSNGKTSKFQKIVVR